MQCKLCGFVTPDTSGLVDCIKCGGSVTHSTVELLSDPALGVVSEIRPGQIALAKIFDEHLKKRGRAVVSAQGGCGVGKSFAYLLPAILSGKRTIVLTSNKGLQEQLEHSDIPYLQEKIGLPASFVSVKGKSNYLCKRLLYRKSSKWLFREQGEYALWEQLCKWAEAGEFLDDLTKFDGGTDYPVSTVSAKDCDEACSYGRNNQCGYQYLKGMRREVDLVITNHSLFGYDLMLGVGMLFGEYNIVVVDEAHACPEYFRSAFSDEITLTWLKNLFRRLQREKISIPEPVQEGALAAWQALFKHITISASEEEQRDPKRKAVRLDPGFFGEEYLARVRFYLGDIRSALVKLALENWRPELWRSIQKSGQRPPAMDQVVVECLSVIKNQPPETQQRALDVLHEINITHKKLITMEEVLVRSNAVDDNFIYTQEFVGEHHVKVVRKPLNLAPLIKPSLREIPKLIFTSATLPAKLLEAELGITVDTHVVQPSPFNYRKNALIYLPRHIPRPGKEGYHFAVAEEIQELIRASQGNALVLFTARDDLIAVKEITNENFESPYPIFTQDEESANAVLKKFHETENSVIFGMRSFFEGVDIPGLKLRLVIVTKLPFPPQDPFVKARCDQLKDRWWRDYYFPQMLLAVQQAVGRLIRTLTDKGVVAILDARIWTGNNPNLDPKDVVRVRNRWQGYGSIVVRALPFDNIADVRSLAVQFLQKIAMQQG